MKTALEPNLLADIFTGFGQMVWSKDIPTGTTRFLTDNFEAVFEIPMKDLRNDPSRLNSSVHPEDVPFIDLFSKVLLSSGLEVITYRICTPSGKIKWISERKQLVKNEIGEICRLDALLTEITEQKVEEGKLVDSESTFKALFYKHPNPMWVYDLESLYFLAVNDAAVRFYGYTHDEFFKMTVKQIRPKEDLHELLMAIETNDFESYSVKNRRHTKKDGSVINVKLVSNEINFRGRRSRMVLAMDITSEVQARSQMEKVHRYLESFQSAISETSQLALIDQLGNLVYVNENLLSHTELQMDEVVGKHFSLLNSNIYKKPYYDEIWKTCTEGKVWQGEQKFFRKQGPHFWANCSIIPIKDEKEKPIQYLLLADDISSLKDAERKNREYAVRLHDILEGVTDAIFVLNRKWLVINVNRQAEELLGQKRNSLIGTNIWEIFPHEEGFRFYQFFRKAKKGKVTVQFEEYFAPLDQWHDISLYPSKDGLAVCFRNVTERRKKEKERAELMEHLISQNRDLEEFTYIASHSLRAQIANISMLCTAIDGVGLTPSNHEIFEKLFQSSANLDEVMGDLNTILTVKDRNQILYEDVLLQNTCVNAISKLPYSLVPFKKCVKFELQPGLHFYSVRNYLETILFHFISNALRYRHPEREPNVVIQGSEVENFLVLEIQDNGLGIDIPRNLKQLFQLYKTFHPGKSGKGLGLYLSKTLVEELKGTIDFKSRVGLGTSITIRIPKVR